MKSIATALVALLIASAALAAVQSPPTYVRIAALMERLNADPPALRIFLASIDALSVPTRFWAVATATQQVLYKEPIILYGAAPWPSA